MRDRVNGQCRQVDAKMNAMKPMETTAMAASVCVVGVGMSGVPIFNVNNNCATGSTALYLARQAVASGAADCVLALGFEHMNPGALGTVFKDRPSPVALRPV